jgi:pimeloyl-ACP methyl ester carboxylesterase
LTLSDYLAALRAEVARLGAAPILVGHSMGGLLAQQLAASGPCRALVCIASAPPWCLIPPLRSVRFLLPAFPAILFGWTIPHSEWALRNLALTKLPESEQRELVRTLGAESGRAFRAMWFGLARLPGPRFTGPVLCLSGRDDRIVADRTSRALARSYDARHVTFEQSGHWLIAASAQGDVAGTVMRWLEKNQLTA